MSLIVEENIKTISPCWISREGFEMVTRILIDNAFQHGGDAVSVNIRVEPSGQDQLAIYISDSGAGISAENKKKRFTPFFTTARKKGGTGLGLSIAVSLLKLYQASLEIESGNDGTTAKILLYKFKKVNQTDILPS